MAYSGGCTARCPWDKGSSFTVVCGGVCRVPWHVYLGMYTSMVRVSVNEKAKAQRGRSPHLMLLGGWVASSSQPLVGTKLRWVKPWSRGTAQANEPRGGPGGPRSPGSPGGIKEGAHEQRITLAPGAAAVAADGGIAQTPCSLLPLFLKEELQCEGVSVGSGVVRAA